MTTPPRSHLFTNNSDVTAFSAGARLFAEGDPGNVMYVVRNGQVDLLVAENVVETVGPDGMLGELALLDGETRSTAAVVRTNSELVVVDQKQFMLMVRQTPFFAIEVMRVVAARLRAMNARLAADSR